jgi:hypothetical protein
MPGFLGGSTGGSSGTGGEISFPKEFIDPVTKLRVSQPENLIDTDFEYGLQPTKWETVELINNTPSFFSKSGDTTIPNIISITTNAGTREITVVTALEHGVSVGIPIQVTGTKSVTADGSYIINSIPNTTTFTYLCKANQPTTSSIEDLYSSIITGEFFQGSQLRVADASGIVTNNAEGSSTLTITTESAHGFKTNTPFYFLNLNSTISKDFQASNTAAKSFDSTNSAVAQTFDGSNTLSSINIDWSNSATVGGVISNISAVSTVNNTITVAHSTENFVGQPLGTPLYYAISGGSGYFATNPRGVIFLKSIGSLGASTSTFQVSAVPDGDVIPITAALSGTFQLANQARTFAGNNVNPLTQTNITVIKDSPIIFDGGNQGFAGPTTNGVCTVEGYAGTILVSTTAGAGLDYYVGAMVRYNSTGSVATSGGTNLTNNGTYFIATFATTATPNQFRITIKELPDSASALAPTGGSGDQTFTKIGVSTDKDIVHAKNANFLIRDMIEYTFPAGTGGRFTAGSGQEKLFYIVDKVYDAHNYQLSESIFSATVATGGATADFTYRGSTWRSHTFTTVGTTDFVVSSVGTLPTIDYLIVGGGGSGGGRHGGGGGAGGFISGSRTITATTYPVVVGNGGVAVEGNGVLGNSGGPSSFGGETANGGGGGGVYGDGGGSVQTGRAGGSGGGSGFAGAPGASNQPAGVTGTAYGFAGGINNADVVAGGGGGAGGVGGTATSNGGDGGPGRQWIDGFYYAAGGGGGSWNAGRAGNGGIGGGGGGNKADGGGPATVGIGGGSARNAGGNGNFVTNNGVVTRAGSGGANTGSGGGGAEQSGYASYRGTSGAGGSGIVIIRYQVTPSPEFVPAIASGGTLTTVVQSGITYRVHAFTTVGSSNNFVVSSVGSWNDFDYVIVAGGGGGGGWGGGGGAGGVLSAKISLSAQTYPIVVGGGGARGTSAYTGGGNGGNSSAFSQTAFGGGGAGFYNGNNGANGGSGGGGGLAEASGGGARNPGNGTTGQGTSGGGGGVNVTSGTDWNAGRGGGGGGAGEAGYSGVGGSTDSGRGGRGLDFSAMFGTTYGQSGWFGGGGGGHSGRMTTLSIGGQGGGGRGGRYAEGNGTGALSGLPNTGGGGGGAWGGSGTEMIGDGGSGIVLVRYPIAIA